MADRLRPQNPSADHPVISPKERLIEKGLREKAHKVYQEMPWWKRTHEFTSVWDQTRRKRLGLLTTAFPSFQPRWEHPDWAYFNKARRIADAFGARYEDWINVQINRVLGEEWGEIKPADMVGHEAIKAFKCARGEGRDVTCPSPQKPPFIAKTFDIKNPVHKEYVYGLLKELLDLAPYMCHGTNGKPADVLAEAVCHGLLPLEGLNLRPDINEAVRKVLSKMDKKAGGPRLII